MRRSRFVALCLLFLGLAAWVTWPLVREIDAALPGDLGDPLLNTWILGWDADRLRHGLAGLWDAPIFYPYRHSLAFSEHLLGIAVPVAPIVWLTGRPIVAYNVAFIASFALSGIGMWLLARRVTARDDAALVAGVIFAFAPARFAQIGHLQVLMSGWMPLALWALHKYLDTWSTRALAMFTAAFLVQGLSNGYYIYFLSLPVVIVAVDALVHRPRDRRRIVAGLAASAVVVVAAFLPIARVYFDVRHAYALRRTEADVAGFGADLGAYFRGNEALRPPIRLWHMLPHFDKPLGPEGELFPGLVAGALTVVALVGFRSRRRPQPTVLYATIAAAALLLSLGARPTVWGHAVPLGAPYRWLFAHVPGFDGLRVPARFSMVVLLAVAVLAGSGFARVTDRWRVANRRAAMALVVALVLLEGVGNTMPLAFMRPHGRPDRAAYSWIRDQGSGVVFELPAGELDLDLLTFRYEYQTLFHHHPIVNGASGYESALQTFLGSAASPLMEPDYFAAAVHGLRSLGVRWVVVHPDLFPDSAAGPSLLARLREQRDQVSDETMFPGLSIFTLVPLMPSTGSSDLMTPAAVAPTERPIPRSDIRATASHGADRVARLLDGDLASRWLSGGHQTGTEAIELAFDRPRAVSRVQILTSGRSIGDYPRELAVDLFVDNDSTWRSVYRAPVIEPLMRGLIADPVQGPIDIVVPPVASAAPGSTSRVRLRQLGHTRIWLWSVDEVVLWERPAVQ